MVLDGDGVVLAVLDVAQVVAPPLDVEQRRQQRTGSRPNSTGDKT